MPTEPHIKPLSLVRRTWVFRFFLLVFALLLPIIIFYTTGYRFEFTKDATNIVSTGGLYISVPSEDSEIFINDVLAENVRTFRRASYVQNLTTGIVRVHVQGEGVETWVKELPIQPHIVTEVQAFNLPLVPQIRLIAPWVTQTNIPLFSDRASSTLQSDFAFASTTEVVFATTTLATTTLVTNEEYDYVLSLFGTTTNSATLVDRVVQGVNDTFTFASATTTVATTTPTTTIIDRNTKLFEVNGEVYVSWVGPQNDIPYYFCFDHTAASSTKAVYGTHVFESAQAAISSMPETESSQISQRICRDTIKIDNLRQEVISFTFVPGSTDFVLMHLTDGVYVVEVDDRAWQNTQTLYAGTGLQVLVENNQIFIKDREYYLEVFTEIQTL